MRNMRVNVHCKKEMCFESINVKNVYVTLIPLRLIRKKILIKKNNLKTK